jgi:hypothetical protein
MKVRSVFAALAAFACVGLVAASDLKSGPQVGDGITPFHPYNVFNAEKPDQNGKQNCIVCQYGPKPAVLVFARNTGKDVVEMIKKLDAEVGKVGQEKLGAAVIFLSADDNIKETVKEMAEKAGAKNVCLAVDSSKGPEAYKLSKDADVTVVLYKKHKVVANHAFDKFDAACLEKVVGDLPKVASN